MGSDDPFGLLYYKLNISQVLDLLENDTFYEMK